MTFQCLLPVVFKEEFRIIQTGPQYLFIAMLHVFQGLGAAVSHSQEIGHEASVFLPYRIVPLMVTHGGNHSRYRQLQEFIINSAVKRRGVFHQVVDFFEKICIVPYMAAQLFCCFQKAFFNHVPSFILVHNNEGLSHGFLIIFRFFNGHRFFAKETMAPAYAAALHMSKFHRNHLVIGQCYDPPYRADEMGFFIGPAHASGEIKTCNEGKEKIRQYIFHCLALVHHMGPGIIPFLHQLRRVNVLAPGKSLGCAGGVSISIKSRFNGRATLLDFFIRLAVSCILHQHCQPSGGGINFDFMEGNAIFFKLCTGQFLQLFHYASHNVGRHFLCSDFQKKILTHFPSLPFSMGNPSSFLFFSQPLAHILARFLTRAMYSVRSDREIAPAASRRLKEWEHFST